MQEAQKKMELGEILCTNAPLTNLTLKLQWENSSQMNFPLAPALKHTFNNLQIPKTLQAQQIASFNVTVMQI